LHSELNIERIDFGLSYLRLPIIVIIGPPGAGKTVVGKHLANILHWDFYDTDIVIENATSLTIPEIFSKYSETAFRQLEKNLVTTIANLSQANQNTDISSGTIISCGGGLPVPPENFNNLAKSGMIVCLKASPAVLLERVSKIEDRPLLNSNIDNSQNIDTKEQILSRLEELISSRKEVYDKAQAQIDTTDRSIEEIISTIINLFAL
jgi:shikimate kinase